MAMDDPNKACKTNASKAKLANEIQEVLTESVRFELPISWGTSSDDAPHDASSTCKRLATISRSFGGIIQVYGKAVGGPIATESAIAIPVEAPLTKDQRLPRSTIYERLQRTAEELKNNVTIGPLRRHGQALTDVTLVPILRAIAQSKRNGDPPPILVDDTGRHPIPVLDTQDFDEPDEGERSQQSGTFVVTGVRVGAKRQLFALTSGGLAICLDSASASKVLAWSCQTFYDGAWIEGTIERNEDGIWMLQKGAKLTTTTPMPAPAVDGDERG